MPSPPPPHSSSSSPSPLTSASPSLLLRLSTRSRSEETAEDSSSRLTRHSHQRWRRKSSQCQKSYILPSLKATPSSCYYLGILLLTASCVILQCQANQYEQLNEEEVPVAAPKSASVQVGSSLNLQSWNLKV